MHLIIGGIWQGKRDYAIQQYGLTEKDFFTCTEEKDISYSCRCIDSLEEYVMYCVKNGVSAREMLEQHAEEWKNSVMICREIFSGIVPIDPQLRLWREETGRTLTWLVQQAEDVTRMFCGIPQKLK